MSKPLGSDIFGTTEIRADEFVLLGRVITDNGGTPAQAMAEIHALDDMLQLQKVESLLNAGKFTKTGRLRKNQDFLSILERRIDGLIKELNELDGAPNAG